MEEGRGSNPQKPSAIIVNVKFAGRNIPVEVSADATVNELKSLLQPLTNVLPRGQKIISKGKVIGDEMTLRSSGIVNGSKIMLMGSQGLHQGDGPITKEASPLSTVRRPHESHRPKMEKSQVYVKRSDHERRWQVTGVLGLSDSGLKAIPDEIWNCGHYARLLDLNNNSVKDVPAKISRLDSLTKLFLNANGIEDKSLSWEGIASLKHLEILSLNENQLTIIPSNLGALRSLQQLHIANNKLTSLPTEIGLLTALEVLKANNNRLNTIPNSIGGCASLVEIDLSCNLLTELPDTLGTLKDLKALYLRNNGLTSLPTTIFKFCTKLSTLDLHATEITVDHLRQFEGWDSFDERRRLKHQKQLDFRVSSSGQFDEGADRK
ncbi:PREDICTED: LRR repeats and ubiquitin-like domain-containing protein At2g30105 isoform X1 [Ipomoea nil]|uniref:LRR repeats and ubiquitin-like domain-containing protein At2g30105 isoform X1 n=1 Tax=Ipomoea nil TaxID=35883 RepID=UPI0009014E90|nr:PREDICTED: LRR repeats and ubiquitin-like domain-containing protein At2g30105 isoform X1 [Ipomoea nil]